MKRSVIGMVCVSVALAGVMFRAPVYGFDLGLHLGYHGGAGTAEPWSDNDTYAEADQEIEGISVGLLIDSPIAEGVLSNRLMLLYQGGTMWFAETVDQPDIEYDISRYALYDTLAFSLAADSSYRFWLGPQLGVFLVSATDDIIEADWSGFGLGIGGMMGLDFIVNENFVFGIEAGLRVYGLTMEADNQLNNGADVYGVEGVLGVAALLRI